MKPIQTPQTNITFKGEGCADLPAMACHDNEGNNYIISVWELTQEELEIINKTGLVYLSVMGTQTPPVFLSGKPLFVEEGSEQ